MIHGIPKEKIEILAVEEAKSAETAHIIRLKIAKDYACPESKVTMPEDVRQWFHFTLQGKVGAKYCLIIEEVNKTLVPDGWKNYQAKASYDGQQWFEVAETQYDGKNLTITILLEQEQITFAYFRPFTLEQQAQLINLVKKPPATAPACKVERLGSSIEGRDINLVIIGEEKPEKLKLWVIAGQHPGEPQGLWFVKGLIETLLGINAITSNKTGTDAKSESQEDTISPQQLTELLTKVVFFIVPNMNPDGLAHGNIRVNAMGRDLNRWWDASASDLLKGCPEAHAVRTSMYLIGVDLLFDAHGDEASAKAFFQPAVFKKQFLSTEIAKIQTNFMRFFSSKEACIDPDLRYPVDFMKTQHVEGIATEYISNHFSCPAVIFEMPYKNWSAEASLRLGQKVLAAFFRIQPELTQFRSQYKIPRPKLPDASSGPNCVIM